MFNRKSSQASATDGPMPADVPASVADMYQARLRRVRLLQDTLACTMTADEMRGYERIAFGCWRQCRALGRAIDVMGEPVAVVGQ